jgi:hypothetical protein
MKGLKRLLAALLVGGAGFGLFVACGGDETSCSFDADCADGEACEGAVCVATCTDAAADCAPGEICGPGLSTDLNICRVDSTNGNTNGDTNGNTNGDTNGNTNGVVTTTYVAIRVQSESTGDEACANASDNDPGPDIYAIGLEDTGGSPLGWGSHISNLVQFDSNDHTDTSHLDGSAPSLDGDSCPDQFDGNVVALGCDAESWLTVEFFDDGGNFVPLVGDGSQQVVVYEFGAQCGGTVVDEYRVDVCTDIEAVRAGDATSCSINILQGGSAIGIGPITGF